MEERTKKDSPKYSPPKFSKKILLNNILPPWKREPKKILLNIPLPNSQKRFS
jgi:hypothetical protein